MERGMAWDSINAMHGVQVLAECELEDRERSLTIPIRQFTVLNTSTEGSTKRTYREMMVEYARK